MSTDNNIPVFVKRDPAIIMAECKTKLEELLERELQPAQVEQLILQFIVYREVLLTNRFNAGMAQMLYQFSKAPVLDYIAGLVAVERLPAARAGCTVRFMLVPGHDDVLIPEGTRIATVDGKETFSTIRDIAISEIINTVDVEVLAETPGKSANGYAIGTVKIILDPLAFVSAVANIGATGGGSDVETDAQLRERIKLAPSQYSSAGSRSSYEFYAKSANALIIDVSISSPKPGTVLIVPLTESDETPEEVIKDVKAACNPEDVRPLTDKVEVKAPKRKDYNIDVEVILYEHTDAVAAKTEITKAIEDYSAKMRKKLGQDIIRSHIAHICGIASVYDVTVKTPAENIVVEDTEFTSCNKITVTIKGFNRG